MFTHSLDPQSEVILSCDASPCGVGAVLSHKEAEGEKPIVFASRSLSSTEPKYAQLDKEGLAIIYGVKKFHDYIFGKKFTITSEHKPLQHLFAENWPISQLASARIQCWALSLSAYEYTIAYKSGDQHANADSLSRLPLPEQPAQIEQPADIVLLLETLQASPMTANNIRRWTDKDPQLSRIRNLVQHGWKDGEEDMMKPFNRRSEELSVQDGCVLWECRVVVPIAGQVQVLKQLHDGHPGVSRMKSIARSLVWWPGIDKAIESEVEKCDQCQLHQKTPSLALLHPWEWPNPPWSRVHIDHAGPFQGKLFLILVDAHSMWLEVMTVPSTSSEVTLQKLRVIFSTRGLPEVLVSDNASCFTSNEFREFMSRNGIRHITSAPYHPASNGLAERSIQTFKEAMKNAKGTDIETQLSRFLFHYRNTPHTTTGHTPAELLLGHKPRSHLTLMQPNLATRVRNKVQGQVAAHYQHTKERHFQIEDPVFAKNFGNPGIAWIPGIISEVKGPLTFHIELNDGCIIRRHIDHIRSRTSSSKDKTVPNIEDDDIPWHPRPSWNEDTTPTVSPSTQAPPLRRSSWIKQPPDHYQC